MTNSMRKLLEQEQARHANTLTTLANLRLQALITSWGTRSALSIKFGMGTEFIRMDGRLAHPESDPLLEEALIDVWEITRSYREAVPDDIDINSEVL